MGEEAQDSVPSEEGKEQPEQAPNPGNPFGNLDAETQQKIQELQMLEQAFQQLAMQKNTFNMEASETEHVINEVENSEGELMRIVSGQVAIKSTKEKVLEEMNRKKELIDTRMKQMEAQEKEFSEKIEKIREDVMKKING
jgi:prefoldin beta subunit